MLNSDEIRLILKTIQDKYGQGYSDIDVVARLQAKLSVMLEVTLQREGKLE